MASTALRASTQSANNTHMVFMDEEHERLEIEGVLMIDGKDGTSPSTSDKAHAQ